MMMISDGVLTAMGGGVGLLAANCHASKATTASVTETKIKADHFAIRKVNSPFFTLPHS